MVNKSSFFNENILVKSLKKPSKKCISQKFILFVESFCQIMTINFYSLFSIHPLRTNVFIPLSRLKINSSNTSCKEVLPNIKNWGVPNIKDQGVPNIKNWGVPNITH